MYFGNSTRSNRDSDNGAGALGAVGAMLSVILAPIAASLIQMAISRTREYDADEDGSVLDRRHRARDRRRADVVVVHVHQLMPKHGEVGPGYAQPYSQTGYRR